MRGTAIRKKSIFVSLRCGGPHRPPRPPAPGLGALTLRCTAGMTAARAGMGWCGRTLMAHVPSPPMPMMPTCVPACALADPITHAPPTRRSHSCAPQPVCGRARLCAHIGTGIGACALARAWDRRPNWRARVGAGVSCVRAGKSVRARKRFQPPSHSRGSVRTPCRHRTCAPPRAHTWASVRGRERE